MLPDEKVNFLLRTGAFSGKAIFSRLAIRMQKANSAFQPMLVMLVAPLDSNKFNREQFVFPQTGN